MGVSNCKNFKLFITSPRLAFYELHSLVHSKPRINEAASAIEELLTKSDIKFDRLVDYGCGLGSLLTTAKRFKLSYCGLDIDDDALRICNVLYGGEAGVEFSLCKDGIIPITLSPRDILVLNGVVHHLTDEEFVNLLKLVAQAKCRVVILDHVKVALAKTLLSRIQAFLQAADKGKFVRNYDYFNSLENLKMSRQSVFTIHFLGMPLWNYFCHTYQAEGV